MAYDYVELNRTGSIDEKGVRKYTRNFKLGIDDFTLGPKSILDLIPINLYDPYLTPSETDLPALCKSMTANQTEEIGIWDVTYEYDSAPFDAGNEGDPEDGNNAIDPNLRPWIIRFGSVKTTRLLQKDLNNVEVTNSAGVPFDPPIEAPHAHPTISVTAWKTSTLFSNVTLYTDAINSDAWEGFAPKTLRCSEYTSSSVYENNTRYWEINITLEVLPDGFWNPVSVIDAGFLFKGADHLLPIEENGLAVTSPVPLDGSGGVLGVGYPLVYLDFKVYREEVFAGII